jgi:ribosomal protein L29
MKELKNKNEKELLALITDKKAVLRDFRFNSAGSKTKNVKLGQTTKKEIAQIMTELSLRKNTK